MLADVLIPIGSIVEVADRDEILTQYMIIGRRVVNHETFRSWDYVSVPLDEGMQRKIQKDGKHFENFFYFNHYEIQKIISEFESPKVETT